MTFLEFVKRIPYYKEHPEQYKRSLWFFFPDDTQKMLALFDAIIASKKDDPRIIYMRGVVEKRASIESVERIKDFKRKTKELL